MRRSGKQYASDKAVAEAIRNGHPVGVFGIKTEQKALDMQKRLKDLHDTDSMFEPMYRTAPPRPIFDMNDPETPIIGNEYPEKVLTGYLFKLPVTLNEVEASHYLQLKGGLT